MILARLTHFFVTSNWQQPEMPCSKAAPAQSHRLSHRLQGYQGAAGRPRGPMEE